MVRICRPDVSCPDGLSFKRLTTVDKGHFRKYIQSQEQRRTHGDRDLYPQFPKLDLSTGAECVANLVMSICGCNMHL